MDDEKDLTPELENDPPGDYITLTGQDGQEYECELVDTLEYNGQEYVALVAEVDDPDLLEGDGNFDVMRSVLGDDGEAYLEPIDDDEEYREISELFMERLADLYVFEEMDEEEGSEE